VFSDFDFVLCGNMISNCIGQVKETKYDIGIPGCWFQKLPHKVGVLRTQLQTFYDMHLSVEKKMKFGLEP
jgi:hypothetical protein